MNRLTELHTGAHDQNPHISLIAPLSIREGDGQKALGALVLINDARDFLYPLIQSWTTESESAVTLLVEKVGDTVLYLNDLRHQKGTALKLRFGLTETNMPPVVDSAQKPLKNPACVLAAVWLARLPWKGGILQFQT